MSSTAVDSRENGYNYELDVQSNHWFYLLYHPQHTSTRMIEGATS